MTNIALVSNDTKLVADLQNRLVRYDYGCVVFDTVENFAMHLETNTTFELYIMDFKASQIDFDLIKSIRANRKNSPVLITLDKNFPGVMQRLLHAGVDDLLVRPFELDEAMFRILKLCNLFSETKFRLPQGVVFYPYDSVVEWGGKRFGLGKKERMLLEILAKNFSHVVTLQEISAQIYGEDADENSVLELIRSLARELRKKLPPLLISTIRGVGYKLEIN